jgi:hypothetical protein
VEGDPRTFDVSGELTYSIVKGFYSNDTYGYFAGIRINSDDDKMVAWLKSRDGNDGPEKSFKKIPTSDLTTDNSGGTAAYFEDILHLMSTRDEVVEVHVDFDGDDGNKYARTIYKFNLSGVTLKQEKPSELFTSETPTPIQTLTRTDIGVDTVFPEWKPDENAVAFALDENRINTINATGKLTNISLTGFYSTPTLGWYTGFKVNVPENTVAYLKSKDGTDGGDFKVIKAEKDGENFAVGIIFLFDTEEKKTIEMHFDFDDDGTDFTRTKYIIDFSKVEYLPEKAAG